MLPCNLHGDEWVCATVSAAHLLSSHVCHVDGHSRTPIVHSGWPLPSSYTTEESHSFMKVHLCTWTESRKMWTYAEGQAMPWFFSYWTIHTFRVKSNGIIPFAATAVFMVVPLLAAVISLNCNSLKHVQVPLFLSHTFYFLVESLVCVLECHTSLNVVTGIMSNPYKSPYSTVHLIFTSVRL